MDLDRRKAAASGLYYNVGHERHWTPRRPQPMHTTPHPGRGPTSRAWLSSDFWYTARYVELYPPNSGQTRPAVPRWPSRPAVLSWPAGPIQPSRGGCWLPSQIRPKDFQNIPKQPNIYMPTQNRPKTDSKPTQTAPNPPPICP